MHSGGVRRAPLRRGCAFQAGDPAWTSTQATVRNSCSCCPTTSGPQTEGGPGPRESEPVGTYGSLPPGEVGVRRGKPVYATDGEIGQVEGLVIDPGNHHVSHLLLQEGHVFGRRQVVIPIGAVTEVIDGVQLNITKQQVENLPPVNIDYPSG